MSTHSGSWSPAPGVARFTWGLGFVALLLGGLVALLGYDSDGQFGAGIALVAILVPLSLIALQRQPVFYALLLLTLLAVNCFGFLTDTFIFFRAVAGAAILGLALRFATFEGRECRVPLGLFILACLGTAITFLQHPGMEPAILGVMWVLPMLGMFIGIGLMRQFPQQVPDLLYGFALLGGVGVSLVNLYQWAEGGFVLRSYLIEGAFLNANVTAAMLSFFVPLYLAMTTDRRIGYRAAGWFGWALATIGALVLVSRTALGLALAGPLFFAVRRWPLLTLLGFCLLIFLGYTQTGLLKYEEFALPEPIKKLATTYRLEDNLRETSREVGYAVGALAVAQAPIDGHGFGSGRTIFLNAAIDSYGPENLWFKTWLEGGLYLVIPAFLMLGWQLYLYFRILFTIGREDPFLYALALCGLLTIVYFAYNQGVSHMSLRTAEGLAMGILMWTMANRAKASEPATTPS